MIREFFLTYIAFGLLTLVFCISRSEFAEDEPDELLVHSGLIVLLWPKLIYIYVRLKLGAKPEDLE